MMCGNCRTQPHEPGQCEYPSSCPCQHLSSKSQLSRPPINVIFDTLRKDLLGLMPNTHHSR
jgi:hypothetical protein